GRARPPPPGHAAERSAPGVLSEGRSGPGASKKPRASDASLAPFVRVQPMFVGRPSRGKGAILTHSRSVPCGRAFRDAEGDGVMVPGGGKGASKADRRYYFS
ncbi:hypothetical protein DQ04_19231000, partial [Trypanosoma grayi]|uniref:hypothetical protein n=1 Tax=Trypanosoma grayi TaxID=71804 RepID=UPI0004F41BD2